MNIFILSVILSSMFFGLNAKFDTLQEWTTECFKNYREYAGGDAFSEPKSVLTSKDFNEALDAFNGKTQKAPYNVDPNNPYATKIRLSSDSKICFIGDIHGSLHSLLRALLRLVALGYLKKDFSIPAGKKFYMVFTGDFVDRGRYGFEVIYTLIKLKLKNMDRIFLLRGNHEIGSIYVHYGFFSEMDKKGSADTIGKFDEFCNRLPLALFIGSGKNPSDKENPFWIQCCHGGIEPTLDPNVVKLFLSNNDLNFNLKDKLYQDPVVLEAAKTFKDAFAADGLKENNGFTWCDFNENGLNAEVSYQYGRGYMCDILGKYLDDYNIKSIFRGHQHSVFGLKIGGKTHWTDFKAANLSAQASSNPGGFSLSLVNYPVFTFSTGSEGVQLPYDCFGILTVGEKWEDWKLLPYEFDLTKDPAGNTRNRNGKFVKITKFKEHPAALEDPIEFEFVDKTSENPIEVEFPKEAPEDKFHSSLIKLKDSLTDLKGKLQGLSGKLGTLKTALAKG